VATYAKLVAAPGVRVVEERDGTFTVQGNGKATSAPERIRIVNGEVVATAPSLPSPASGGGKGGGAAAMLKASRAELVLQPDRFVIRPLELPRRATEFLDGIVRAQIDRLTPWSAENAAFGWSAPVEIANERVLVTVAATARSVVTPFVSAVAGLGADSIAVSTIAPEAQDGATAIKVFDQRVRGALELSRVRRALAMALLVAAVLAGGAIAAGGCGGGAH